MVQHFKRWVIYIASITTMFRFISLMFILITYCWVFVIESISSTKKRPQNIRSTIWHTRCVIWTQELIEVQTDCWEWYWFSFTNRTVLLWLIWSCTVTNQSYRDFYSLRYGINRKQIVNRSLKSACIFHHCLVAC